MEDSLEDYIRIVHNIKHTSNLPKDVAASLDRKKQCESYAFKIVEFLIDGKLQPQVFLKSLCFIDQEHYQDIVEERALTKICGYALCGKKLPTMPSKQYHISNKLNKVYDISERKNFCSNYCYQASSFIKNQIDTSPLWLRRPEDFPKFTLLDNNKSVSPGIEIEYGIKNDADLENIEFTSVASFTEACLDEAEELELSPDKSGSSSENINTDSTANINGECSFTTQNMKDENINTKCKRKSSIRNANKSNKNKKVRFQEAAECVEDLDKVTNKTEIESLNDLIENLCNSLNIKVPSVSGEGTSADVDTKLITNSLNSLNINEPSTSQEGTDVNTKVITNDNNVKINEDEMSRVINKINTNDDHISRQPILINTVNNPEINRSRDVVKVVPAPSFKNLVEEAPKYSKKLTEKIKKSQDTSGKNVQDVIQKVKQLQISKSNVKQENEEKMRKILEKLKKKDVKSKGSILVDTMNNPEVKAEKLIDIKSRPMQKLNDAKLTLESIKTLLLKWLTFETYTFVHTVDKIKSILNHDTLDNYFDQLKVAEMETTRQMRYMNICKKLQLRELAEDKFDKAALEHKLKPLPDYSRLKEEGKDLDLKVKSFYTGELHVKDDPNFKQTIHSDDNEDVPAVLPNVDASNQNAFRKKIFINNITKYIQQHLIKLDLEERVLFDVQNMIKTFKLEADNVMFKPIIWNAVGLILIWILKIKDEYLNEKLNDDNAVSYLNSLLEQFVDGKAVFEEILFIIQDVEKYAKKYITVL